MPKNKNKKNTDVKLQQIKVSLLQIQISLSKVDDIAN